MLLYVELVLTFLSGKHLLAIVGDRGQMRWTFGDLTKGDQSYDVGTGPILKACKGRNFWKKG